MQIQLIRTFISQIFCSAIRIF